MVWNVLFGFQKLEARLVLNHSFLTLWRIIRSLLSQSGMGRRVQSVYAANLESKCFELLNPPVWSSPSVPFSKAFSFVVNAFTSLTKEHLSILNWLSSWTKVAFS